MGGSSGFCKAVKKCIEPYKPAEFNYWIVDGSYVLQYILSANPNLAYKVFCCNKEDVGPVVAEFKYKIIGFLNTLSVKLDSCYMVWEESSQKSDRRSTKRARIRASILNRALRRLHRNPTNKNAQKSIGRSMGRPPRWFTQCLMESLSSKCPSVLCPPGQQADDYIARMAIRIRAQMEGASIAVVGNDRDFLVYPQPESIKGIVYKKGSSTVQLLKEDVSQVFRQLQAYQLPAAYFLGGCDDNPWKIKGIGFQRALDLVSSADSVQDLFDKLGLKADEDDLKILERGQESSLTSEIVEKMKNTFLNLLRGKILNFIS